MRASVVGIVLFTLCGLRAFAAPADDPGETARRHFVAGTAALDEGRVEEGLAELQAANRLVASAAVYLALADAYHRTGDPAQAAQRLRAGLRIVPAGFALERRAIDEAIVALESGAPVTLAELRAAIPFKVVPALPPLSVPPSAVPPPLVLTRHPPVYKQWWLWTIVGIVAAGTALGVGLGLTSAPPPPMASTTLGTVSPF